MKKLFIIILVFLIFTSCDSDTSGYEPTVYVGGSYMDNGQQKACYWVNGKRHILDGESVNSITAVNGKVYAAGYYRQRGSSNACYWADGYRYDLPGLLDDDYSVGRISVDDGNVYIVGATDNGVCYWVNGIRNNPPAGGIMRDVFASGGKVYISGHYTAGSFVKACYWINGVRQELPGSEGFFAGIIAVKNNIVYIAGRSFFDGGSCYWVNGKQFIFPEIEIISLAVSKDNVYIAYEDGFYKNGKFYREYPEGSYVSFYTKFAVSHGKIFMCGNMYTPGYFIDNTFYDLDGSAATAIYVEE
jgi:hypothetical protein